MNVRYLFYYICPTNAQYILKIHSYMFWCLYTIIIRESLICAKVTKYWNGNIYTGHWYRNSVGENLSNIVKCVRMFVILKMLVLLQYTEHCNVVGGCIYNQYNLELSFLGVQSHIEFW